MIEPQAAGDYVNEIPFEQPFDNVPPTRTARRIQAYAKLQFENTEFYVQTLQVTIGRKAYESDEVDVHLGGVKSVSRRHARIAYNFTTQSFEISVLGKNGAFVDDIFVPTGTTVPLYDKTKIQVGQIPFTFLLPNGGAQILPTQSTEAEKGSSTVIKEETPRKKASAKGSKAAKAERQLAAKAEKQQATNPEKRTDEEQATALSPPGPTNEELAAQYEKPNLSYAALIAQALQAAPRGKATLQEVYEWIENEYPWYKYTKNGWHSSIRHNLSLNKSFKKIERQASEPGKGAFWCIDPDHEGVFVDGIYRRKPTKAASSASRSSPSYSKADGERPKSDDSHTESSININPDSIAKPLPLSSFSPNVAATSIEAPRDFNGENTASPTPPPSTTATEADATETSKSASDRPSQLAMDSTRQSESVASSKDSDSKKPKGVNNATSSGKSDKANNSGNLPSSTTASTKANDKAQPIIMENGKLTLNPDFFKGSGVALNPQTAKAIALLQQHITTVLGANANNPAHAAAIANALATALAQQIKDQQNKQPQQAQQGRKGNSGPQGASARPAPVTASQRPGAPSSISQQRPAVSGPQGPALSRPSANITSVRPPHARPPPASSTQSTARAPIPHPPSFGSIPRPQPHTAQVPRPLPYRPQLATGSPRVGSSTQNNMAQTRPPGLASRPTSVQPQTTALAQPSQTSELDTGATQDRGIKRSSEALESSLDTPSKK